MYYYPFLSNGKKAHLTLPLGGKCKTSKKPLEVEDLPSKPLPNHIIHHTNITFK